MDFQLPVNVETGLTRSRVPVPKNTPPAENEASATKEIGPSSIDKIHAPSIVDGADPLLPCMSACAMALELKVGTARARMVKVFNRPTVLRLIAVMLRTVIMSLSPGLEFRAPHSRAARASSALIGSSHHCVYRI